VRPNKSMVGNNSDICPARGKPLRRLADFPDRCINSFKNGDVLGTKRPCLMFDVVERAEMKRQQRRMLLLEDPCRVLPPVYVSLGRRVNPSTVFAKFRLCLLEQPACRNSAQQ